MYKTYHMDAIQTKMASIVSVANIMSAPSWYSTNNTTRHFWNLAREKRCEETILSENDSFYMIF